MPSGYYRGFDLRDVMLQASPNATLYENFPHDQIRDDLVASLTTAVMTSVAMPLIAGDVITKMSVVSGATALATPVHAWMALYSSAATPALLGQSTDVPAQALAANTVLTHIFSSTISITATGVYYAAICIVATTVPTLIGKQSGAIVAGQAAMNTAFAYPALAQTSGSALTTTAPATITAATNLVVCPYVVLQ